MHRIWTILPLPIRHNGDVKRSREETFNDKHISRTGKYADIFTVATATGCRRCDLKALNTNSLVERDGKYFLDIEQSKGERDRLAPVLSSKVNEIVRYLKCQKKIENENQIRLCACSLVSPPDGFILQENTFQMLNKP